MTSATRPTIRAALARPCARPPRRGRSLTSRVDCAELIRAVCNPPVFLTGLSMGSLIVQQVALDFPELVRCAIPHGGTAAKPTGFSREWMEAEVEFFRSGGRLSREFAIHHYAAFLFPSEVLGDDELWNKVKDVADGAYGERDSEMMIAQWEACIDFDVLDRLPDCKVPMHVHCLLSGHADAPATRQAGGRRRA